MNKKCKEGMRLENFFLMWKNIVLRMDFFKGYYRKWDFRNIVFLFLIKFEV